jgi:DNA-binding NarL/FixJ family response regulator
VENHTVQIYGKLDVHGRRQAVAKALADGLIAPRTWPPSPQ